MRNRHLALVILMSAAFLPGCEGKAPPTVELSGDTLRSVALLTFPGGVKSAQCDFDLKAKNTGSGKSAITLTKGRLVYTTPSGDTLISKVIDGGALSDFFGGTTSIEAGKTIASTKQGLSMSQPVQPIRGTVTFDYRLTGKSQEATTKPFCFLCH
jgi:hypothetical protein